MTKTLAVILHHNTPQLTDTLYEQLKPYEGNEYDIVVLDNGSSQEGKSKYSTYRCDTNVYFGGGLNLAFQLVLENLQYDSLLFLNSDLIVHGYRFVQELRKVMVYEDYKIVSPSVIQPEKDQCFWTNMHNWNSNRVREVDWVDFQCPLIHRDIIQTVKQFDDELIFGWGNDVYLGLLCKDNGWKIGVVDWCSVVHLGNQTVKQNQEDPIVRNYNEHAHVRMYSYFEKIGRLQELHTFREKARKYKYE
jgi:GT2 family glycosyltransferase